MRILAIRGENLASLAGKFEIDFQKTPLADAGVFAISGPTGAGKSTILDALCLALYHDTPRLLAARENGVTVPDIGNRTLSPQDPRNLLRRGCSEGYAEVDFISSDGFPRRARWQVRRARGKKDGALQAPSVSLTRIDTNALEASALRETSDAIAKYVGLTFDQFRRAVLLAQNDFATLLKAGQVERADLLEALTNTGNFSLLSSAAYQRNAREQKELDELRLQLNVLSVLSAEDRTKLYDELTASQGECQHLSDTLNILRKEVQWHERGQRLGQDQAAAAQVRKQLQQTLDADRPQQRQLQQWNAIAPLCPQWDNRTDTARRIATIQSALPGLNAAIDQAGMQESAVREAFQQASDDQEQAHRNRRDAEPVLAAAREADTAIKQQLGLLDRNEQQLQVIVREHGEITAAHDQCTDEQLRLQGMLDAWQAWRQAHPPLNQGDADWNALGETLRDISKQIDQLRQSSEQAATLQEQQAEARADLNLAEQALAEVHAALLDAQAQQQTCEQAWQALDEASLSTAKNAHQDRALLIADLAAALDAWIAAETQHHETSDKIAQLQQQIIDQSGAVEAAGNAAIITDTAASAAHAASNLANLAANQITQRLREALQPGEPCLVCGATEHPQAHTEPSAVDQLLVTLKQQQQAADKARDTAHKRHERTKVELEASGRALAEANAALDRIRIKHDCIRAGCASTASHIGTDMAHAATQGSTVLAIALTSAQKALTEQATELGHQQSLIAAGALARNAAAKAVEQRRRQWEKSRLQQDAIKEQLAPLDAKYQAAQLLIGHTGKSLQNAVTTLRSQCRDPHLTLDHVRDLLRDWNDGDGIRTAAALAREPLATCNATLRAQSSRLTKLDTQVINLTQACETDRGALEQARTKRQHVLAHPDLDAHARELEKAEAECRGAQERHRESLIGATRTHEGAKMALQQADKDLQGLQEQFERYGQQLLEPLRQCAGILDIAAPNLDDLGSLIASLPADLARRTSEWNNREKAVTEADAHCRALAGQHDEWQVEAGSRREIGAASDELAINETLQNTALEKRAELQARQHEDARRHTQAAEHRERIEALTKQARRWQQLNDLIGSANGSKFKTYAQQFTLEVLLDYANQHLARLSTRYRLRRGNEPLSLLMIDADFADEVRSVHSLSGGESFLVSLALALGLASLSSERVRVESLFIDEGFGSLDADTLNMAMEALDRLQSEGRRVGVISHVHDMAERIGVQIRVRPVAPGKSVIETTG